MKIRLGIIYTLLSALGYGSTAVLVINAYSGGVTPWQLLLTQGTLALGLLTVLLYMRRRKLGLLQKFWPLLLAIGLLGYTTMMTSYTLALQYLPGSIATLIFFTYPVLVTVGARVFYGETFTKSKLAALVLALVGVVLTSQVLGGSINELSKVGVALCLFAALGATILTLLSQRLVEEHDPLDIALVQHFFASLGLITLITWGKLATWSSLSFNIWLLGFSLTILTSLLPTFLALKGIAYLGASRASIIATAEIPITLFLVFVFLQEHLTGSQWLGSGLIFSSVFLLQNKKV